jgi:hypothetical protein
LDGRETFELSNEEKLDDSSEHGIGFPSFLNISIFRNASQRE